MSFDHAIRLLSLAANAARANKAHQESYGTKAESERQRKLEKEFRAAVALLEASEQGVKT
jgi:hypothetical protein